MEEVAQVSSSGPIGVFDSGVGGLTVVGEIRRHLPGEDILYFGDTARVPYGNKYRDTVIRYSREIGRFLSGKGIRFLVVACNTSSSWALDTLSGELDVPVLGMIEPGARAAVKATRGGRVGLIGTRATVSSGAYSRAIQRIDPSVRVFSVACPLFVPLVEEGWADDPIASDVAERYLAPLLAEDVDSLILGCTHYPVLVPVLKRVAGEGVTLISSAASAVAALAERLSSKDERSAERERGSLTCYVTDAGTHFREVGENILGEKIRDMQAVDEERLVLP
jgi:glutamate racemase